MCICFRLLSKQHKLCCSCLEESLNYGGEPTGWPKWNWTLHAQNNTLHYTASNDEISLSTCSARDVQVSVVALTDLLPNLWLQALSINNKNLRQCIPCRGDDSTTSVAGTYQTLPTQTICSVQGAVKKITVIILISIPIESRWPGTGHRCSETQYVMQEYN
jgi:hypothetical protein